MCDFCFTKREIDCSRNVRGNGGSRKPDIDNNCADKINRLEN